MQNSGLCRCDAYCHGDCPNNSLPEQYFPHLPSCHLGGGALQADESQLERIRDGRGGGDVGAWTGEGPSWKRGGAAKTRGKDFWGWDSSATLAALLPFSFPLCGEEPSGLKVGSGSCEEGFG